MPRLILLNLGFQLLDTAVNGIQRLWAAGIRPEGLFGKRHHDDDFDAVLLFLRIPGDRFNGNNGPFILDLLAVPSEAANLLCEEEKLVCCVKVPFFVVNDAHKNV